ncbi:hypothetical protein NPIL_629201 [Nephila pilipes]|uniref:Uncharacterized protein n=1 Tax=Nephila pilipes TaxID=299642 RepID=A0A8X6QWQ9_NEPPI|nr:hypothetical protein NPIL_629201 [Nephila pilipes]
MHMSFDSIHSGTNTQLISLSSENKDCRNLNSSSVVGKQSTNEQTINVDFIEDRKDSLTDELSFASPQPSPSSLYSTQDLVNLTFAAPDEPSLTPTTENISLSFSLPDNIFLSVCIPQNALGPSFRTDDSSPPVCINVLTEDFPSSSTDLASHICQPFPPTCLGSLN